MRWPLVSVKQLVKALVERHRATGLWDGWSLTIPSVGVALVAACLAVPRPVEPGCIPLPTVPSPEINRVLSQIEREAEQARATPLSYEVRTVGEMIRQLGREVSETGQLPTEQQRARIVRQAHRVQKESGDEPLLRLRSVQAMIFLDAIERWEKTGQPDQDLIELGGELPEQARREGWIRARHLLADRTERIALFLVHFNQLTGLSNAPRFYLPPCMERILLRFLIQRTPIREESMGRFSAIFGRLRSLQPSYPTALARGIVAAKCGDWFQAALAFRRQLAKGINGPWSLPARNYLLFTEARLAEMDGAGGE